MIPSYTSTDLGASSPNWFQSRIVDGKLLLPGGVYLDFASFNVAAYQSGGKVVVPSGTLIARTIADRTANKGWQPLTETLATTAIAALPTYEISILYQDLNDLATNWHGDGVQPRAGNLILENFLPGTLPAAALGTNQRAILTSLFTPLLGNP